MKAICWYGKKDVRVENVPEPKLLSTRDAIVKTTLTAICGSDLHLYHGVIPTMEPGDILGHEFMGEVVEVGTEVPHLKKGDRVVVPFCIACGNCFVCRNKMTSLCDNSNPNASSAEKLYGSSAAGLAVKLETDRTHAWRPAIFACRKGGTVSIPGVYGGLVDKFPLGVAFNKGATFKMGQTNVHTYMKPLLDRIERGEIDPSVVITHRFPLDKGSEGYSAFDAQDSCIKVVLKP